MSEAPPDSPGLPGALGARYVPEGTLGEGGFGRVVLARDRELDRRVAVKVLLDPRSQRARQRFLREAEVLSRLRDPHVVEVYDSGEVGSDLYMVMEYLEGAVPEPGAMEPEAAVAFALEVAEALEALHGAGVVHRDLKRDNLLVHPARGAVLVDFGLVREEERTQLTASGAVVGTIPYLAPEVLQGREAGPPADWYGLGVTLYELVEGRLPYGPDEVFSVFEGGSLPAVSFRNLRAHRAARRVTRALLAPEPEQRPASRAALERIVVTSGEEAASRSPRPRRPPPAAPAAPRRGVLAALAVGFLIGGLAFGTRRAATAPAPLVPARGREPPSTEPIEEAVAALLGDHVPPGSEVSPALAGVGYEEHLRHTMATYADPRFNLRLRRVFTTMAAWSREVGRPDRDEFAAADRVLERRVLPAMLHFVNDLGLVAEFQNSLGYQGQLGIQREGYDPEVVDAVNGRIDEMHSITEEELPTLGIFASPDRPRSLALRSFLAGTFAKTEMVPSIRAVLEMLPGVTNLEERATLVLHASYCVSSAVTKGRLPCELRAAMAHAMQELLRTMDDRVPASTRVSMAGRVVTQFYPVLSSCNPDRGFDLYALYDAAADVLERDVGAAPALAEMYLKWFSLADDVVLGSIVQEDPARWSGIVRRIREVRERLGS